MTDPVTAILTLFSRPGFSASQAWFYVTLLTVGFLVSRGLAKINWRGDNSRTF